MNRRGFLGGLLAAACTAAVRIYSPAAEAPRAPRTALPSPRFRSINEGIEANWTALQEFHVIRHGWLLDGDGNLVAEFHG